MSLNLQTTMAEMTTADGMNDDAFFNSTDVVFGVGMPINNCLRIFLILFAIVYTAVGVPGHILTICSILKVKNLRKRLNVFIINLAISDLIRLAYLTPLTTADLIVGTHPGNYQLCQFSAVVRTFTCTATFINILLIAVSRYTYVCFDVYFDRVFTRYSTAVFCVCSWLPGLLSATATLLRNPYVLQYNKYFHMCYTSITSVTWTRAQVGIMVPVSFIFTLICYWKLWRKVKQSELFLKAQTHVFCSVKHGLNKRQSQFNFVILVMYIFLSTPLLIIISTGVAEPTWIHQVSLSMMFCNSMLNCIVYGFMNKAIRKTYNQIFSIGWNTNGQSVKTSRISRISRISQTLEPTLKNTLKPL